jgi:hypothetical protein
MLVPFIDMAPAPNGLRKLPADFVNATQFYPEEIDQKSRRIPEPKAGQLNAVLGGIEQCL